MGVIRPSSHLSASLSRGAGKQASLMSLLLFLFCPPSFFHTNLFLLPKNFFWSQITVLKFWVNLSENPTKQRLCLISVWAKQKDRIVITNKVKYFFVYMEDTHQSVQLFIPYWLNPLALGTPPAACPTKCAPDWSILSRAAYCNVAGCSQPFFPVDELIGPSVSPDLPKNIFETPPRLSGLSEDPETLTTFHFIRTH